MKAVFPVFCFILVFIASFSTANEKRAVAILLDVSRSVSPPEFEQIKSRVMEFINQDPAPDELSVYVFGNKLRKINHDQLKSVRADESNTLFYDAAYDAMQDLVKTTAAQKMILVFSDGKDTKSVTVPEDIVSLARDQKIVIHCVGMGQANQKLLERIAKLTGGRFFSIKNPDLVPQLRMVIAAQKTPDTAQPQPAPIQALPSARSTTPNAVLPVQESKRSPFWWIAVILGTIVMAAIAVLALKKRIGQPRVCPTCEKPLEPNQLICPDCTGQTKILSAADVAADMASQAAANNAEPVPPVWLERKQDTQEILSKTYFLDETPVLVVTKGQNVGESYRLSKESPVSIGRSRLNEIRPDDGSISAQHCRIIPENGEYVLYDLGSTNGTIVNNINVNKAVLEEGDTIKVGATTLLFTMHTGS